MLNSTARCCSDVAKLVITHTAQIRKFQIQQQYQHLQQAAHVNIIQHIRAQGKPTDEDEIPAYPRLMYAFSLSIFKILMQL